MAIDWYGIAEKLGYESPSMMLDDYYYFQEESISEIARRLDCSYQAVHDALERFGVPIRRHGGPRHKRRHE